MSQYKWEKVSQSNKFPSELAVLIETPMASKNIYHLDHFTGLLNFAGMLSNSRTFPFNFGIALHTLDKQQRPLHVVTLSSDPIISYALVNCKPIGGIQLKQKTKVRNVVIAIAAKTAAEIEYKDIFDLWDYERKSIKDFLTSYEFFDKQIYSQAILLNKEQIIEILKEDNKRFIGSTT